MLVVNASSKIRADQFAFWRKKTENIEQYFMKTSRSLMKTMEKQIHGDVQLQKFEQDIEVLASTDSGRRYPTGTRLWKSPLECIDVDNDLPACVDSPQTVTITFPQKSTYRRAMSLFHHTYTTYAKRLTKEVLAWHQENNKARCTKSAFIKACRTFEVRDPDIGSISWATRCTP